MTFNDLLSHCYWATKGDERERRQGTEAAKAYIAGLLELQREFCAMELPTIELQEAARKAALVEIT